MKAIHFDFDAISKAAEEAVKAMEKTHYFVYGKGWFPKNPPRLETSVENFDRRTADGEKLNLVTGLWYK